jgi:glycogen operon protein
MRQIRNFLTTLMLSQGVPMLLAGDESGRTQRGNNNAYAQDNELTWQDWELNREDQDLLGFTRELIKLRLSHRVFRRRSFFQDRSIRGDSVRDIVWLDPNGSEMTDQQWHESFARSLGVFLSGRALNERNERGKVVIDSDFLLLVNAHHEQMDFDIPMTPADAYWTLRLDTSDPAGFDIASRVLRPGETYTVQGRALALFEYPLPPEDGL